MPSAIDLCGARMITIIINAARKRITTPSQATAIVWLIKKLMAIKIRAISMSRK
jgi:hypothetical protein